MYQQLYKVATVLLALCLISTHSNADTAITIDSDGWQLQGDLAKPDSPVAFAILLHKAAGDRSAYNEMARVLAERSIASIRLDLRGHGESINLGSFNPTLGRYLDPDDERIVRNFDLIGAGDKDILSLMGWLEGQEEFRDLPLVVIGSSYTGQEMVEAARESRFADVYVALAPGSFDTESIAAVDPSGVPWLFVRAEVELPFFPSLFNAIGEGAKSAEIWTLPGEGHATDLFEYNPGLEHRLADWINHKLHLEHASQANKLAGFASVGTDRIYFESSGDGAPLVLVSGGSGMDLRQWHKVIPLLAKSHRVITYDPRGIGKSDNPTQEYSDSDDLVRLLDYLQLDKVTLVGLSSSGGFALEFAARFPGRLHSLIASAPFVPGYEFSPSMQKRVDRFAEAAQGGREVFLDAMMADPHFVANASEKAFVRKVMAFNVDKGAGFDPQLRIPVERPLIQQLQNIETPVLLLAGGLDHEDILHRNRYLQQKIHGARVSLIPGAGHNPQLENPADFAAEIIRFAAEIDNIPFENVRRLRLEGQLDKAAATALEYIGSNDSSVDQEHQMRLELATIYDRQSLHDGTRPSEMALGQLRSIESKASMLSAEVLAGLNYGFARYFYRAEMPGREFEIAEKYVTQALDAYKSLGDIYGQAEAVHLQGLIEMQRGNYEGAGVLFDESLRLDELAGARVFFRGEYDRHMGFVLYFEGKLEESLLYFRRSVEARRTAGATDPLVFAEITLASVLNQLGNDHEALPVAKDALTSARKIGSKVAQVRAQTVIDRIESAE
jgi:pimeloyl-ACP methyl ester carboxylesterase